MYYLFFTLTFFILPISADVATRTEVAVGIDVLLHTPQYQQLLKGKRIGLITNHSAINRSQIPTSELIKFHAKYLGYYVVAFFAPEHGIDGASRSWESVEDRKDSGGIPIYSLHGKNMRPTEEMLKNIDLLLFDMQDIGSRSYTYINTLFFAMEEAKKYQIPVVVLDRPNPINGIIVDGPMLEPKWRSIVGYCNVPYCHGLTVAELALYFNEKYKIGCQLIIIPMSGWTREMSFKDTGLPWIPTSPNIPEPDTPYYYPTTGILGELQIVNIGIGYTLPFKVVGAPWIDSKKFAKNLNDQYFPGIHFQPFSYRPFYGRFANETCHGVLLIVTDHKIYKPVSTQYLIIGMLKSLYPKHFHQALENSKSRQEMFSKVNGTDSIYNIMNHSKYIVWKMIDVHKAQRNKFINERKNYLIYR